MGFWRVARSRDFKMLGFENGTLRENRRMRYVIDNPVVSTKLATVCLLCKYDTELIVP